MIRFSKKIINAIAFPQRDMHLNQIGPLEVLVLKQEMNPPR